MLKANAIAIGDRWDPTNPENILLQVGRHVLIILYLTPVEVG